MQVAIFKIKCLTNMHVGSGELNFNIIDNEVQRDPVTKYPSINSSGVKGALREFITSIPDVNYLIKDIFGNEHGEKENENFAPGKLKFLSANMLAIPMRTSNGDNPYYLVTSETALNHYKFLLSGLNIVDNSFNETSLDIPNVAHIEGVEVAKKIILFNEDLYIMDSNKFEEKIKQLPVMARNHLDNGKSDNLWYEEIVPHQSVFYFAVIANDCDSELLTEFSNAINDKTIQFGGKASIGYGFCKVSKVV